MGDRGQDEKIMVVQNRNMPILFASSAGGVFSALAAPVLRAGGVVGGAAWTDGLKVRMELVETREELARLRGAKYLMADGSGFVEKVRDAVASGREVLICALPCQVAELRRALGSPANLTLVDIVCGGLPPEEDFRAWVRDLEVAHGARVAALHFETKEFNAWQHRVKVTFANRQSRFVFPENAMYLRKCLLGCADRRECAACPYRRTGKSEADVTLETFLGRPDVFWNRREHLGVSKVVVRTSKGMAAYATAAAALDVVEADELPLRISRHVRRHSKHGFGSWPSVLYKTLRRLRFNPYRIWNMFGANGFRRIVDRHPNIKVCDRFSRAKIQGKVRLLGDVEVGFQCGPVRRRHCETILHVAKSGELKIRGYFLLCQGSQMLVSGKMDIGKECGFNDDAYILCEDRIVLGRDVRAGRCVTIRDTNGGHWMNFPGFRVTKPVVIGDHVWLCEGCTIMPGVTIGSGAVVGARAVVFNNVPPNSLVIGNPAKVVCSGVEWKE